jgi:DNA-binding CsgD family transcriptional regulator
MDLLPSFRGTPRGQGTALSWLLSSDLRRDIADQLMISYEAARGRSKALRRKLGVSSRAQVVAKVLQLGLGRLGGR